MKSRKRYGLFSLLLSLAYLVLLVGMVFLVSAQEHTVDYIIILKEQPLAAISQQAHTEYAEDIAELESQISVRLRDNQVLSYNPQAKALVMDLNDLRDREKKEILEKAAETVSDAQSRLAELIEECGGTLTGSTPVINALFATLPEECYVQLQGDDAIAEMREDRMMAVDLDFSACTLHADTFYSGGYNGSTTGIWDVALVDTGINATHPALHVSQAQSFVVGESTANDLEGHGTHTAGIIASTDAAYRGIGYGVRGLINAKACNRFGSCAESWNMLAMDWAISQGADIMSRSITMCDGGDSDCPMARYIDAVIDNFGISFASSAGNSGPSGGTVTGIAFNAFSVAASDHKDSCSLGDDIIASFSSRGPTSDGRRKPDITAPGVDIISANSFWQTGADFVDKSGTSMATPMVAGAAALVMDYKASSYDPRAVRALLLNSANSSSFSSKNSFGFGYLDLAQAWQQKDFVVLTDVSEDGNMLYRASLPARGKATLAWNRHVLYNGSEYPGEWYPLNNLNLYLYAESDSHLINHSLSSVDNVEQVISLQEEEVVIRVRAFTQNFTHGSDTEQYALAASGNLTPVSLNPLNLTASVPDQTANRTVNISLFVHNPNEIALHAVNATLHLSSYLTIQDGNGHLAHILPQQVMQLNWTLTISAPNSSTENITFNISSSSYGISTYSQLGPYFISFNSDNHPPQIQIIANITVNETQNVSVFINATDQDNDTLSYAVNDSRFIMMDDNLFIWNTNFSSAGNYTVRASASDGWFTVSQDVHVEVQNLNAPPQLQLIPNITLNKTEDAILFINASDLDADLLIYAVNDSRFVNVSANTFVWHTGYYDVGNYSVNASVADAGFSVSQIVYIEVRNVSNLPPRLDAIGNRSVQENATLQFYVNATDYDQDSLSYGVSGLPDGASFAGQWFNWTPNFTQSGTYNLTFTVNDTNNASDSESLSLTVLNTNRAPSAPENVHLSYPEGPYSDTDLTCEHDASSDPDGESITYIYAWYKNNNLISGSSQVYTSSTQEGASYSCGVQSYDGIDYSNETASAAVTIISRPPSEVEDNSGGGSGGGGGGGGGGSFAPSCTYWNCTGWRCTDGVEKRVCTEVPGCTHKTKKPDEIRKGCVVGANETSLSMNQSAKTEEQADIASISIESVVPSAQGAESLTDITGQSVSESSQRWRISSHSLIISSISILLVISLLIFLLHKNRYPSSKNRKMPKGL